MGLPSDFPRVSIALLVLYAACIYTAEPAFFSAQNLCAIVYYTCLLVPAVVGVHILIVLGLIDLSIGAVAAMCGVIAATAMTAGITVPLSLLLSVLFGLGFGVLNWVIVVRMNVPALIGTLITMGIARAVSLGITEGISIGSLPASFGRMALGSNQWSSFPIAFGALLILVVEALTKRHVLFRRFYQIGSNTGAATGAGINVTAVKLFAFITTGVGAALVGLFQCSRTLSASPFVFPDLALECIAACVIGGANLSGGAGRAVGAVVGMAIVVVSRNLVVLTGVSIYWKELGVAVILFLAILMRKGTKRDSWGGD
jgi:ribose transport system permease protein